MVPLACTVIKLYLVMSNGDPLELVADYNTSGPNKVLGCEVGEGLFRPTSVLSLLVDLLGSQVGHNGVPLGAIGVPCVV